MKRKYDPENASKAVKAAAQMPPLHHTADDNFDVTKSEVVAWLISQPAVLNACFNFYKDKCAIVFDKEFGTWKGINS